MYRILGRATPASTTTLFKPFQSLLAPVHRTASVQCVSSGNTMVNEEVYSSRWENMWMEGIDHGQAFDANRSAPVLVELLESEEGQVLCKGKRAVVPGCGRGYDLVTFAKYGAAKAVGMEISQTAVGVARSYVKAQPAAAAADVSVELVDWLDGGSTSPCDGTFDVGYDYTSRFTIVGGGPPRRNMRPWKHLRIGGSVARLLRWFFCALHPGMRRAWAEGWARRLRPGGTLIALAFPIEDSDRIGPPWPLQLADYEAALVLCGFKCVRQAAVPPAQATVPDRAEREILTLWVKE